MKKAKNSLAVFSLRKRGLRTTSENFSSSGAEMDKKLVSSLSKTKIPNLKQLKYIGRYLNKKERRILKVSFLILFLSVSFLAVRFYQNNVETAPIQGGDYTEGLIGIPRFINPLYSGVSDVDSDISRLVFSSLFYRDKHGYLISDLAEEYEISEDNKVYTVKIRQDAEWHNGNPVTIHDLIFTFNAIKNPVFNSTLRNSFLGVTIEQIDNESAKFILEEPYASFWDFLTFGIIPENLWMQIPPETASLAELNLKPIGSGPYKFHSLTKDRNGVIKSYNLTANNNYYRNEAYIKNITFNFFPSVNEAVSALNEKTIDGIGFLPAYAKERLVSQSSLFFHELKLPHLTAIFLNQNKNANLKDLKIRQALSLAINKERIVDEIFHGGVEIINGPILPGNFAHKEDVKKYHYDIEEAKKLFEESGWEKIKISAEDLQKAQAGLDSENEEAEKEELEKIVRMGEGEWFYDNKNKVYFIMNLTTVDNGDNARVVEKIKKQWEEFGVKTELSIVAPAEIQSSVIKPRNFEALFYGQVVGSDPDVYVFWHSSQRGENGLNIADYSNSSADKLLEDARLIADQEERIKKYHEFQDKIAEDVPAVFMYSPLYTYVQSRKINGFDVKNILKSSDRFNNITDWYIKTGKKIIR